MGTLDQLLARLEQLVAEVEELEEPTRGRMLELLDGIDALHRLALGRLPDVLGADAVGRLREEPATAWLLEAYGVGLDEREVAERALDAVRPYVESHGGRVEILDAADGVVRVRLAGACSGCTASAITLKEGIERALEEGLPGFRRVEAEEDAAPPHPPPTTALVQLSPTVRRPR